MPKPLKKPAAKRPAKPKRPADPNRAAHAMLAEHMARTQDEPSAPPLDFDAAYRAHMAKLGAKGGKASGAKRMTNLSEAQRKRIAKKAAAARWSGRKKDV
jgi:hypothetical protein